MLPDEQGVVLRFGKFVSTTQPGDFLARSIRSAGGRTYMGEEDLSKAFGYEETKDLPPKKTVKKLKSMGVDNAVERAKNLVKTQVSIKI